MCEPVGKTLLQLHTISESARDVDEKLTSLELDVLDESELSAESQQNAMVTSIESKLFQIIERLYDYTHLKRKLDSNDIETFLEHVYSQVEKIFSSAEPTSRSTTPVSSASKVEELESVNPPIMSHNRRRVQLFGASTTEHHAVESRPSTFRASHACDFTPLSSSTPAKPMTLMDFMTPDGSRMRKSNKVKCSNKSIEPNRSTTCNNSTVKTAVGVDIKTSLKAVSNAVVKTVQPSRRITPTMMSKQSNTNNNRLNIEPTKMEPASPSKTKPKSNNFDAEREKLKEKRKLFSTPGKTSGVVSIPSVKTPSKSAAATNVTVKPKVDEVIHPDITEKAADVFSFLILSGLTAGICKDLHMLVQLLCCHWVQPSSEVKQTGLLITIHDAVYFSTQVLLKCPALHRLLDSSTIRILSQNDRVVCFCSQLHVMLTSFGSTRGLQHGHSTNQDSFKSTAHTSFTSVSFQSETDNSNAFPSERTFIVFKKQRDLFYELIREWETHIHKSDWNFRNICGHKIYSLLNNGTELSNYIHFSRLFVNQLILSCHRNCEDLSMTEDDCDTDIAMLSQLKLTQPDKYRKLRERLVKPASLNKELTNPASFEGMQAFFQQFIQVSKDAVFLQHLQNVLSVKLFELNDSQSDIHAEADHDSSYIADSFYDCVLTLRLVAKFLGFIHFLPYQGEEKFSAVSQREYIHIRASVPAPLDIQTWIESAIEQDKMFLLLPWLIQYFAQIDANSFATDYFKRCIQTLVRYQRALKSNLEYVNNLWLFYQYLCLESLLNLSSIKDTVDLTFCEDDSPCPEPRSGYAGLITSKLLNEIFPELNATKKCLLQHELGLKNNVTAPRKITPISEKPVRPVKPIARLDSLQQRLEDNFFHNQSVSLLKMVAYLAERISSAYIKEFRAKQLRQSVINGKKYVALLAKDNPDAKVVIIAQIHKYSTKMYADLCKSAMSGTDDYCSARSPIVLPNLLPRDTPDCVLKVCNSVLKRQMSEKVYMWLQSYFTQEYIATELSHEVNKILKNKVTVTNDGTGTKCHDHVIHNDEVISPTDLLQELQYLLLIILTKGADIPNHIADVANIFRNMDYCVHQRADFMPLTQSICCQIVLSIIAAVLESEHRPNVEFLESVSKLFNNELLVPIFREHSAIITKAPGNCNIHQVVFERWSSATHA